MLPSKEEFEQVIINNQHWLMRYVVSIVQDKLTAEDIVQEVFIRAYQNYGDYEEQGRIRQWLRTIARNLCMRHIQRSKKWNTVSLYSTVSSDNGTLCLADVLSDEERVDDSVINNEFLQTVLAAIRDLPNEQRQVVYFRYIENLSISTVADLTTQPVGSVKSKAHYGLAKVRKRITNYLMEGEYVMNCEQTYPFYFQYAKGKIMAEDQQRVERHIAICESCKKLVSSLQRLVNHITPAQDDEIRHWAIEIPLGNQTLVYFGVIGPMHEHYERMNRILAETEGKIPDDDTWFGAGHNASIKHIGEFDNEGNRIEYKVIQDPHNPENVRIVYTRVKHVFQLHTFSSVGLTNKLSIQVSREDPNLMIGKVQNALGGSAKSGLYLALPGNAKNIRIKKGNDIIDAGHYKFAFSERYVTENETLTLECSYLKQ